MAGLIPLLLRPAASGNRTSVVFPQSPKSTTPTSQQAPQKSISRKPVPSPVSSAVSSPVSSPQQETPETLPIPPQQLPSLPELPPLPQLPKQRAMKRLSNRLSQVSPPTLPVLPYTNAEWAKCVADVKRQYLNRRYRPCSVRCSEILENVKDPVCFDVRGRLCEISH
jgi:hypothetical protein